MHLDALIKIIQIISHFNFHELIVPKVRFGINNEIKQVLIMANCSNGILKAPDVRLSCVSFPSVQAKPHQALSDLQPHAG